MALGSLWLTGIQPFAVLVVGMAVAGWLMVQGGHRGQGRRRGPPLRRLALFVLCSLPFLLYDLWITRTNPHIARWMAQNVTPSPPAWQWLVA